MPEDNREILHDAISRVIPDDELAIHWIVLVEVAGPEDSGLATYTGGGIDGTEDPSSWTILGALLATAEVMKDRVLGLAFERGNEDESEDSDTLE